MEIAPLNSNAFAIESPYDISADTLVINQAPSEDNNLAVNGIEPTATSVAINAIPPESIELRELQDQIVSTFDELRDGNISREDFSSSLEELGVNINPNEIEGNANNEQGTQAVLDLTSALIESLRGNSEAGSEIELSSYAAINDIVNQETQDPRVNEQLQSYTQNLRY